MAVHVIEKSSDYAGIVAPLASAFRYDPMFLHAYGGEVKDCEEQNKKIFGPWLWTFSKMPESECVVHSSEDGMTNAVWMLKGGEAPNLVVRTLRFVSTALSCGPGTAHRLFTIVGTMEKMYPKERHVYLALLGTASGFQGKGTGGVVLDHMLKKFDEQGLPVYTESSNVKNVPFYERHGFKVIGFVDLEEGSPVVTRLWRERQQ